MSQCDSPYVTRYFGSYVSGTKLWIVMEYVGGGSVLVRSTPTHCLVANPNPNPSQAMATLMTERTATTAPIPTSMLAATLQLNLVGC